eukprot:SAG22_NODE_182_length_16036_cov_13.692226_5_plen_1698_part_00
MMASAEPAGGAGGAAPIPWDQLRDGLQRDGWSSPTQLHDAGEAVVGATVFVAGLGEGLVQAFNKSRLGASSHTIVLGASAGGPGGGGGWVSTRAVKLRRKRNSETDWLLFEPRAPAEWTEALKLARLPQGPDSPTAGGDTVPMHPAANRGSVGPANRRSVLRRAFARNGPGGGWWAPAEWPDGILELQLQRGRPDFWVRFGARLEGRELLLYNITLGDEHSRRLQLRLDRTGCTVRSSDPREYLEFDVRVARRSAIGRDGASSVLRVRAATEGALQLWTGALNAAVFLADLRSRLAFGSSSSVVFENLNAIEVDVTLGDILVRREWWWKEGKAEEELDIMGEDNEGCLCVIRGYEDTESRRRFAAKAPVNSTASGHRGMGRQMTASLDGISSRALEEFRREVSNLEKMRGHPHVVELVAVLQIQDTVFVVTEAVEGGSLLTNMVERDRAGRGRFAAADLKCMLRQLLHTLAAVHAAGLTHRNVSLDSILCVDRDDVTNIKLGDFELSRQEAATCGTRVWDSFTPPELVDKVGTSWVYDGRKVDIWQCGIVMYTTLMGEEPLRQKHPRWPTVIAAEQLRTDFSSLISLDPARVCPEMAELLTSMLNPEPSLRPTASELLKNEWLSDGKFAIPAPPESEVVLEGAVDAVEGAGGAEAQPEDVDPADPDLDPYDGSRYTDGYVGTFASAEQFADGLVALVGPCAPGNPFAQMRAEHCDVPSGFGQSDLPFSSSPNHQDSTPAKEWLHVYDPHLAEPLSAGVDMVTQKPLGNRPPKRWQDIMEGAVQLINESFAHAKWAHDVTQEQFDALQLEDNELVAARLYSGPMYELYNKCLRAMGDQAHQDAGDTSPSEDAAQATRGKFVTTLHCINGATIKLGQLSYADTVFRGFPKMKLPVCFLRADATGVKGGVELGFTSTTLNRKTALAFANGGPNEPRTMIEGRMNMMARGAWVSWLSQFPDEREVLWPPLTGMQVQDDRVEVVGDLPLRIFTVDFFININLSRSTSAASTNSVALAASSSAPPILAAAEPSAEQSSDTIDLSSCLPACLASHGWIVDSMYDNSNLICVHPDSSYVVLPATDTQTIRVQRHEAGGPTRLHVSVQRNGEVTLMEDTSDWWSNGGGEVTALQCLEIPRASPMGLGAGAASRRKRRARTRPSVHIGPSMQKGDLVGVVSPDVEMRPQEASELAEGQYSWFGWRLLVQTIDEHQVLTITLDSTPFGASFELQHDGQVILCTAAGEQKSVVGEREIVSTQLYRMQQVRPALWRSNLGLGAWLESHQLSEHTVARFLERQIEGQMLVELFDGAADVWRELAGPNTQALDSKRYRLAYEEHMQSLAGPDADTAPAAAEPAVEQLDGSAGAGLVRTTSQQRAAMRLKSHTVWVGAIETDSATVKNVRAALAMLGPIANITPRPKAGNKSWALVRFHAVADAARALDPAARAAAGCTASWSFKHFESEQLHSQEALQRKYYAELFEEQVGGTVARENKPAHTVYIGGIETENAALQDLVVALMPLGELINVVVRTKPGARKNWGLATFVEESVASDCLSALWRQEHGCRHGWSFSAYDPDRLTSQPAKERKYAAAQALAYWKTVRTSVLARPTQPAPVPGATVDATPAAVAPAEVSAESDTSDTPKPLAEWSAADIEEWIANTLSLPEVAATLAGEVDGGTAIEMIREDWKELGATGVKASKIVSQIKKLL